jgi:hypothetical protein
VGAFVQQTDLMSVVFYFKIKFFCSGYIYIAFVLTTLGDVTLGKSCVTSHKVAKATTATIMDSFERSFGQFYGQLYKQVFGSFWTGLGAVFWNL